MHTLLGSTGAFAPSSSVLQPTRSAVALDGMLSQRDRKTQQDVGLSRLAGATSTLCGDQRDTVTGPCTAQRDRHVVVTMSCSRRSSYATQQRCVFLSAKPFFTPSGWTLDKPTVAENPDPAWWLDAQAEKEQAASGPSVDLQRRASAHAGDTAPAENTPAGMQAHDDL